jgi:hypothetical protein
VQTCKDKQPATCLFFASVGSRLKVELLNLT